MGTCRNVFRKDDLGLEIAHIALPSALALTADPIASLIDTAFIGHIGLCLQQYFHSRKLVQKLSDALLNLGPFVEYF